MNRQTGFARSLLPAVPSCLASAVAPANPPPNLCEPAGTEAGRALDLPCGMPVIAFVMNLIGLRSGQCGAVALGYGTVTGVPVAVAAARSSPARPLRTIFAAIGYRL